MAAPQPYAHREYHTAYGLIRGCTDSPSGTLASNDSSFQRTTDGPKKSSRYADRLLAVRKEKRPHREIAGITPETCILSTTRYETHHFGSVNPCPLHASAVGTTSTEVISTILRGGPYCPSSSRQSMPCSLKYFTMAIRRAALSPVDSFHLQGW